VHPPETSKLAHLRQRIDAVDADLSDSSFQNVNFSGALLDDVNLAGATIRNANLHNAKIYDANLSGVAIADCNLAGATINGIPIDDLLAAYNAANK
jgi:uncharacterized protein YjbI with pentapeptide repeats